ncbi:MAG: hypothetical protein A2722_04105 [Candidatus Doudnabacteria bacterium RIFCSPHIGHO2_01_FULL_50_11]|uniref:Uncharacterized protein n=1 Tax=Candidatus Doudnabacteria bacterium RIFCSPHIGHO2_01_FULL_50_11 TaxID=1817828 RepID=A0A1F5PG29_9BACT|nr:MAG: hypothetical protein A2722_04105 [Candidatus Doudnabacteria bacterium RIFCSPHIGHO2_01_FULL_50_11]HLC45151.1 hypothetical protein [Patescibacteria group bacterium]
MVYFLSSIAAITIIFTLLHKAKIVSVCPICAGVVVTWVGGIIGLYANQKWADPMVIAILMGASMGAVADKYGIRFGLLWKTLTVVLGLSAIYFIIGLSLYKGLGFLLILGIITVFLSRKKYGSANAKNEDLFKECC